MGGTPKILEMDSSSTNLSEALGDFCEAQGIDLQHIAAGAHRQLGKVERHAHWFSQIFERVANECRPSSSEEFVTCALQRQIAKNAFISESGASPYQLVFGENLSPVIGSTIGVRGGRWYGAGLILGRIGIKWIVAHRRNFLRCSPEHLRLATNEEKTVAQCDTNELLGIKNLLEKGQFPKGQFVDLVSQEKPQEPEQVEQHVQQDVRARTAAELVHPLPEADQPQVNAPEELSARRHDIAPNEQGPESSRTGPSRVPPPDFVKTEEWSHKNG